MGFGQMSRGNNPMAPMPSFNHIPGRGNGVLRDDQTRPPNYRTKPCRYFQAGNCKNGDRCTFLHTMEGNPDVPINQQQRFGGGGMFMQQNGGMQGAPQQW